MTRPITELPELHITKDDVLAGRVAALQANMALQYGPIFKCFVEDHFARSEYVCMVGPEANRFVFHTGQVYFSHNGGWTPIIGTPLGKGLLNMAPPEHTRQRKMWNPAFTAAVMESYLPVIEQVITERTQTWPQQDTLDVLAEAREITFGTAAFALAGFTTGPQVDRLRHLFYQQAAAEHTRRDQLLLNLIAERRTRPPSEQRDVLGTIIQAQDDNGQPLSDAQILAHLNILLVAGHETTTTLSAWTLYLLATMPEQRQQITAEFNAVLGDASQPLSVEGLRKLHQLDHFIKEVGRLYPPVLTVPRSVLHPVEFGGYTLPAGTPVRLALGASHLLPHVFAEPQHFAPERFAPPREEDRRTPYGLITFGGGTRICIGIHFAQIETKVLAAHVLRHYDMQAVDEQPVAHAGHLTALLERGIQMRARPLVGVGGQ